MMNKEKELDSISRGVFEQVKWERDIAIEQLHELGYELGQKIKSYGDAISRKNTLAEFKRVYFDNDTVIRCAELILGGMPPVIPQVKTGRWIANVPQYDMLNPQYICSECGNAHTRTTPYCEICGAKMFEPQESEVEE